MLRMNFIFLAMHILSILLIVIAPSQLESANGQSANNLINRCPKGKSHKTVPGPENKLFSQCTPWKYRSCCTAGVTRDLHNITNNIYNFDFEHCGTLSPACKRHFIQDFCFYECSPNTGPWLVEVEMKSRKERFYGVPLCSSDCDGWFNACRLDSTCTPNWLRNFDWQSGTNTCPKDSKCLTFEKMFHNAKDFCEKIWDFSWNVTSDDQACMRLWFNGALGNPNDQVAQLKAQELTSGSSSATSSLLALLSFLVVNLSMSSGANLLVW